MSHRKRGWGWNKKSEWSFYLSSNINISNKINKILSPRHSPVGESLLYAIPFLGEIILHPGNNLNSSYERNEIKLIKLTIRTAFLVHSSHMGRGQWFDRTRGPIRFAFRPISSQAESGPRIQAICCCMKVLSPILFATTRFCEQERDY